MFIDLGYFTELFMTFFESFKFKKIINSYNQRTLPNRELQDAMRWAYSKQ